MWTEEIRIHHTNILHLIHQILDETKDINYEDFRKNELLKEMIFSQLQEIGEASREIMDITNEYEDDREMAETLNAMRNARFNLEAEIGLNMVWGIIQNDLPLVEEQLTRKVRENENIEEE